MKYNNPYGSNAPERSKVQQILIRRLHKELFGKVRILNIYLIIQSKLNGFAFFTNQISNSSVLILLTGLFIYERNFLEFRAG
jgi:hypothetical protein